MVCLLPPLYCEFLLKLLFVLPVMPFYVIVILCSSLLHAGITPLLLRMQ